MCVCVCVSNGIYLLSILSLLSLSDFIHICSRLLFWFTYLHLFCFYIMLSNFLYAIFSCQASWYDDQTGSECEECGGYAMVRPCPVCEGMCNKRWQRDIDMVSLPLDCENFSEWRIMNPHSSWWFVC